MAFEGNCKTFRREQLRLESQTKLHDDQAGESRAQLRDATEVLAQADVAQRASKNAPRQIPPQSPPFMAEHPATIATMAEAFLFRHAHAKAIMEAAQHLLQIVSDISPDGRILCSMREELPRTAPGRPP